MPTFADFEDSAPAIAGFVRERIDATGLCFVGTTRADGWPRVSPMELFECDGRLYVGSMPNAVKARDLRRDPRCCLVLPLADKDDMVGEAKLFCLAREVTEVAEWEAARAAFTELRGFDALGDPGGAHLFCLDVEGAAWQRVEGDDFRTSSWRAGEPVRERTRTGGLGESRDLIA